LKELLFDLGEPLGFIRSQKYNRFYQHNFIAGLELGTYNNFEEYNFYDVLNALSIHMMVKEALSSGESEDSNERTILVPNINDEIAAKKKINLEISKLEFDPNTNNIEAYKKVTKTTLAMKKKDHCKAGFVEDFQFSSGHHQAAEVVINHLKYLVQKKRKLVHMEKLRHRCALIMMQFIQ
jgi:hypothetical protein